MVLNEYLNFIISLNFRFDDDNINDLFFSCTVIQIYKNFFF